MSDNPFRTRIEGLLAQAYQDHAKQVAEGGFHTIEAYREQVGVLRGLRMATDLCAEAETLNRETEE